MQPDPDLIKAYLSAIHGRQVAWEERNLGSLEVKKPPVEPFNVERTTFGADSYLSAVQAETLEVKAGIVCGLDEDDNPHRRVD